MFFKQQQLGALSLVGALLWYNDFSLPYSEQGNGLFRKNEITFHCQTTKQNTRIREAVAPTLSRYLPSWFHIHQTGVVVYSLFVGPETTPSYETVVQQSKTAQKGLVQYDYVRAEGAKKSVLIVPGVVGSSSDLYIMDMAGSLQRQGFNVLVINPLGPYDRSKLETAHQGLEINDFSDNTHIEQAVSKMRELFGQDTEVYSIGFSLGSNYLLRHLGTHDAECPCKIKAALSISGAWHLMTAITQLHQQTFGIYDYYIKSRIMAPYLAQRYQLQLDKPDFLKLTQEALNCRDLKTFDTLVRGRILGYQSVSQMYDHMSCVRHLHKIDVPVLALLAKDDPITRFSVVPLFDLEANSNIITAVSDGGGHCEFFYKDSGRHKRLVHKVAPKFFGSLC